MSVFTENSVSVLHVLGLKMNHIGQNMLLHDCSYNLYSYHTVTQLDAHLQNGHVEIEWLLADNGGTHYL
jgi:hypothetical protein